MPLLFVLLFAYGFGVINCTLCSPSDPFTAAASRFASSSSLFPRLTGTDVDAPPGNSGSRGTTQNWVLSAMFGAPADDRLSTGTDAAWLGNGCTPAPAKNATIGPAPMVNP